MVPHFGLLDEAHLSREEALLMRSKFHYRCGLRRMRENKAPEGISTLYDSMLTAMRWYVLAHKFEEFSVDTDEKLENDQLVISVIQQIQAPIVGADIVEYNPTRDIHGMTAMVAAKLMKELVDKMLKF